MTTTWESPPELPEGAPPSGVAEHDEHPERRWAASSAPVALVAAMVVAFVGGLAVSLLGLVIDGTPLEEGIEDTPPGVLLAATAVQDLGFVGAAILFARVTGPTSARQFGLRATRFWAAVGWAAALYFAYGLFAALWGQLVEVEQDDVLDQLGADEGTVLLILSALVVCVAAPVVEEFFFRGFFFTAVRNRFGLWGGAVLTGIAFGSIHILGSPIGAIVPLMVLGAFLCLLYAKTGSLLPCIAVHAINNAAAFSYMEGYTAGQGLLLVAASLAVCFAVVLPVMRRWRGPAAPALA